MGHSSYGMSNLYMFQLLCLQVAIFHCVCFSRVCNYVDCFLPSWAQFLLISLMASAFLKRSGTKEKSRAYADHLKRLGYKGHNNVQNFFCGENCTDIIFNDFSHNLCLTVFSIRRRSLAVNSEIIIMGHFAPLYLSWLPAEFSETNSLCKTGLICHPSRIKVADNSRFHVLLSP